MTALSDDEHADIDKAFFAMYFPMCPLDLGDGEHRAGWSDSGDLYWLHRCREPGKRPRWGLGTIDISSGRRHHLVARDPLHIEASVLCVGCRDHGYIRDGRWQAA